MLQPCAGATACFFLLPASLPHLPPPCPLPAPQVFSAFVDGFQTYAPLLACVQAEFEHALAEGARCGMENVAMRLALSAQVRRPGGGGRMAQVRGPRGGG